jgi:uncharacterized protein (DUF2164 family)
VKNKKIELPKEIKKQIVEDIKTYFYDEREEEIGDLGAGLLLDFIIEEIGPVLYNQGIRDAHSYLSERLEDLYGLEKQTHLEDK